MSRATVFVLALALLASGVSASAYAANADSVPDSPLGAAPGTSAGGSSSQSLGAAPGTAIGNSGISS